jgi:hypothetical protein
VNLIVRPLVVSVALLALCVPAHAQVMNPPERGLFGSGAGAAGAKTLLDLSLSLTEGYDSDVTQTLGSTTDPETFHGGGFSTLLRTAATYTRRGKAEIGARANSVLRYYSDLGKTQSVGHSAGIGLTTTTIGGLTLLANQSAAFSPSSIYGLFPSSDPLEPGNPGITAPNYTVGDFESYVYTTMVSLTRAVGRRNRLSATGEFAYTDRVRETETWSDINAYSVSGRYSRNTTRNTAISSGLRYRSGEFAYRGGGVSTELALDVGVDYTRPISATRRATLNVNMGVSGADYPGNLLGVIGFQRRYRVVGDGAFSIPLSQGWAANASVRRGVQYESNLPTPVVNNAVRAFVTGLLTRRLDVLVSAGYARAESILNAETLSFDSYTGEIGVRYAVSRTIALNAGYLYYYYDVERGVLLAPGMPPNLERHGVRAGFTFWKSALRR